MSRQQLVDLDAITWSGAVSVERTPQGVQPWRLPVGQRELFEPELVAVAAEGSGVRLAFESDTPELWLTTAAAPPHPLFPDWSFDLLVDGRLHQRVTHPRTATEFHFSDIPAGRHVLELYLYQHAPVVVRALAVSAGATVGPWVDRRPRWIVHGSSITHGGAAAGPSETWPAIVANQFGLNVTNLGYGGQCHLDVMVARIIRDLPADYISLCLGINVYGQATLNGRSFRSAVIGFVQTIRDGHPTTPLVVVSPICHPPGETRPNVVGLTLAQMREQIADAVARLRARGDRHLEYVDGLELFGPEFLPYMPDQLHPNAEGYRQLARQYAKLAMPKLGLRP